MDLIERTGGETKRHPWERSRLHAIGFILQSMMPNRANRKVLDVGCGDVYISRELSKSVPVQSITAIDTNLTAQEIREFSSYGKEIEVFNDYDALERRYYDLVLLLDVIEHVEDDKAFLLEIADRYIAEQGYMLMTVPAFQWIYSSHDRFLHHFRRYDHKGLLRLIRHAGLECLHSGYLNISLLPFRFMTTVWEKLVSPNEQTTKGVGGWEGGRIVSKMLESALRMDNRLSISLNRLGVRMPGLTVWALCRKPR